ncbi:MAG: hypothetical protein JNK29_11575 [Anaerolineales bacterium]|nr:hypothetical protein [Anaerolineales bacterium]
MGQQYLNEPTEVEATYGEDGAVRVLAFRWKNKRWPVFSQGRQWDAPDGRRHTLVMTARERVYELAYDRAEGRWCVVMASEDRLAA